MCNFGEEHKTVGRRVIYCSEQGNHVYFDEGNSYMGTLYKKEYHTSPQWAENVLYYAAKVELKPSRPIRKLVATIYHAMLCCV